MDQCQSSAWPKAEQRLLREGQVPPNSSEKGFLSTMPIQEFELETSANVETFF